MRRARAPRLLVIDDERGVRESLVGLFELAGYEVREAATATAALAAAREAPFDVALVDLQLGAASGLDLLPALRAARPEAALIVLTAIATIEVAVEAMRRGADDFINKPLDPPRLLAVVGAQRERRAPRRARSFGARETFLGGGGDGVIGRQRELATLARAFAPGGPHLVRVYGLGGVGKSALARRFVRWCRERRARVTEHVASAGVAQPALARLVAQALGRSRWARAPARRARVLVIDDYQPDPPDAAIDRWLVGELAPTLSPSAVVVVVSRHPPSPSWAAPEVACLELGALDEAEATALLRARGVTKPDLGEALGAAHGHPLALSLIARALARGARLDDGLGPEIVQALIGRVIGELATPELRAAVEVAAVAPQVDEGLLAALVPDADARVVFDALAARPFVRRVAGGLALHELARAVVVAELRWRAPQRWAARAAAVADELARRASGLTGPRPAPVPATLTRAAFQRAVRDALKHLHEPDRLADNPLAHARVVNDVVGAGASPAARAAALRQSIGAAIGELAELPRQAGLHAALHHTYVVPATKQEVAASLAGVSFASYRRHLLRGTELVAARLWERETVGR